MANFLLPVSVSAAPVVVISSSTLDDFNESVDLLFDPLFAVEFLFALTGLSGGDGLSRVPVRLPLTAASPIPSSGTVEVRDWDLAALFSAVWAAFYQLLFASSATSLRQSQHARHLHHLICARSF